MEFKNGENIGVKKNNLSGEEIKLALKNLKKNFKHLLWFKLFLGLGITIEELTLIRVKDINLKEMKIKIMKGSYVFRNLFIPIQILPELRIAVAHKNLDDYLFEGRKEMIHRRSVQKFFHVASKKLSFKISPRLLKRTLIFNMLEANWTDYDIIKYFGISTKRSTKSMLNDFNRPEIRITHNVFDKIFQED